MTAVTKRPLEEPHEDRKVKVFKVKKQSSPTPSPANFTTIMRPQLALIESSNRTPFEKQVWSLLCQIPRGSFSTYGIMAAHLGSSPRAVGNALRRNPFAPDVPCHRVVATGGALGGFKGKWPKDGEGITIDEKKKLLRGEGVRLDDKGKVIGTPFGGFT
ncbi:hypothetical protein NW762_001219 [Fusarium torreyae]|uniref:Methylated-DNA--protein-cysteine methyltransferase n=1 Tax=Fusarium torreyae TaxID=1237075 RepID=A0A9W8SF99_9HYPO|nr:hypothetical protein NW762_001219 [Fusarium torreyae]